MSWTCTDPILNAACDIRDEVEDVGIFQADEDVRVEGAAADVNAALKR